MPRKIGQAWVEVSPDVRKFARNAARAIERDLGRAFDRISSQMGARFSKNLGDRMTKDSEKIGNSFGRNFSTGFNRTVTDSLTRRLRTRFTGDAGTIGAGFALGFGRSANRGIISQTRTIRARMKNQFGIAGAESGARFLGIFGRKVGLELGPFSTIIGAAFGNGIIIAASIAVVAASPILAAALVAALTLGISGVVIGGLILTAVQHPAVKKAWDRLEKTAKAVFTRLGKIMAPPVARAIGVFEAGLKRAAPFLERMAKAAVPIVDRLAPALNAMALAMLPGIERALKNSKPFWDALANAAPRIGKAIGDFFATISASKGAQMFFTDLLKALPVILDKLAWLLVWLANNYPKLKAKVQDFIKAIKEELEEWRPTIEWFKANGPAMFADLKSAFEDAKGITDDLAHITLSPSALSGLKDELKFLAEALKAIKAVWDGAKSVFSGEDSIGESWKKTREGFTGSGDYWGGLIQVDGFKKALTAVKEEWGIWKGYWDSAIFPWLKQSWADFSVKWKDMLGVTALENAWNGIKTAWQAVVDWWNNTVLPFFRSLGRVSGGGGGGATAGIGIDWAGIFGLPNFNISLAGLSGAVGRAIGVLGTLPGRFASIAIQAGSALWGQISAGFNRVVGATGGFVSRAVGSLTGIVGRFGGIGGQALARLLSAAQGGFGRVVGATGGFVGRAGATLLALVGRFGGIGGQALAALIRAVSSGFSRAVSAVRSGVSNAVSAAAVLPGRIVGVFAGLAGQLYNAGVQALAGLAQGVRDAGSRAISAARDIASQVAGAVAGFFQNKSPSKLMREHGQFVMRGLELGMEDRASHVQRALEAALPTLPGRGEEAGPEAVVRELRKLRRAQEGLATAIAKGVGREINGVGTSSLAVARGLGL